MVQRLVGTFFRDKINRLELAFATASAPFHAELKNASRAAAEHQRRVNAGTAVWEETTDEGEHYDYGAELGERRDEAEEALATLRKAFTFLIYHQWERTTRRWSSSKSPDHKELVKAAKAANVPLDEPGLELMRLLVNTLKHNSAKCGPDLYARRSDLFQSSFNPSPLSVITGRPLSAVDWAEGVVLSDADIEGFFETVSRSVPR